MSNDFRESKYQNESGSKKGNWYINRLDYFQFYGYPRYKLHRFVSLLVGVFCYFLTMKLLSNHFILAIFSIYLCYISLLTFILLKRRICRYKGYLLYPKRMVKFFKTREIDVELEDFDSIATLEKNKK